jgi:hypothetical protein
MKYDSSTKKLKINYHPRHSQENIAVIEVVIDKSNLEQKEKLNIIINPEIGQYTMNYFIVMVIANLFWYCVNYKLSSDAFTSMFNVSKETLADFDESSTIFTKFDKIKLIDSKMNSLLDYVFKRIE